jgi:hypothetical protein
MSARITLWTQFLTRPYRARNVYKLKAFSLDLLIKRIGKAISRKLTQTAAGCP